MTHSDLAALQVEAYRWADGLPLDTTAFTYWQDGKHDADVMFGVKAGLDVTVVVFTGSRTPVDWFRDFMAIANPFAHDKLGPLHPGFQIGISGVWKWIKANTKPPWVIIGHSLGAARATVLTGYMCADGTPPMVRVVWGEPKSCFRPMADLIAAANVQLTSYRNAKEKHHDIVTDVPYTLALEEYVRCGQLSDIYPTATAISAWGLLGLHHMPLYASATPTIRL